MSCCVIVEGIVLSLCGIVALTQIDCALCRIAPCHSTNNTILQIRVIKNADVLPPPEEMAACDVVLMTHSRLGKERFNVGGFVNYSRTCFCDFVGAASNCKKCQLHQRLTPLMQVYWLRLIIDEGHVVGRKQTKQSQLATELLCDRKWGCTGNIIYPSSSTALSSVLLPPPPSSSFFLC